MKTKDNSTRRVKLLSIGDWVKPGEYRVHSRFSQVTNFIHGDSIVAVAEANLGAGPINILLSNNDFTQAELLRVSTKNINIGNIKIPYTKENTYNSQLNICSSVGAVLNENLKILETIIRDAAPPESLAFLLDPERETGFSTGFGRELVARCKSGVTQVFSGQLEPGIKQLRGLGFGLTPSGDDFISGLLLALNLQEVLEIKQTSAIRQQIFGWAKGENPLVNSFLKLAAAGAHYQAWQELVLALVGTIPARVAESSKKILQFGETSGSDMGVGLLLTMKKGETLWL